MGVVDGWITDGGWTTTMVNQVLFYSLKRPVKERGAAGRKKHQN